MHNFIFVRSLVGKHIYFNKNYLFRLIFGSFLHPLASTIKNTGESLFFDAYFTINIKYVTMYNTVQYCYLCILK